MPRTIRQSLKHEVFAAKEGMRLGRAQDMMIDPKGTKSRLSSLSTRLCLKRRQLSLGTRWALSRRTHFPYRHSRQSIWPIRYEVPWTSWSVVFTFEVGT